MRLVFAVGVLAFALVGCSGSTEKNDGSAAMKSSEPALSYEEAMKQRPHRGTRDTGTAAPSADGEAGR